MSFSEGYYTVNQSVVALENSPIANATTLDELKTAKLGAQVGTTSLEFIQDVVQPETEPMVYNDTNDAKSALDAGQIDGIVVDLPTAYYVTAVEFDDAKIVGQFQPEGDGEEFGALPAVEAAKRLVEQGQADGVLGKGARKANPLPLAAGQEGAAFTQRGLQTVGTVSYTHLTLPTIHPV
mgnify:CR=1 FL=1